MKRCLTFLSVLLVLLLASASAAEAVQIPQEIAYKSAKEAVSLISYGEYGMAIKKLKLENAFDEKQLKKFIDTNCKEIYMGSVQTEVSVAWLENGVWLLAVPFEAPEDDAVGALVFEIAPDGASFTRLSFMRWGEVKEGYGISDELYWNVEYTPDYVIMEDW